MMAGHGEFVKAKVHPKFLQSNATSHIWAFSAVAELIDNAYDPDVNAKELFIDKEVISKKECLVFTDNGRGLSLEKLTKMLSFGFSEKEIHETTYHKAVGRYGNGFKSGAMRLAKDALVLSVCQEEGTACVGLLSCTLCEERNLDEVVLPMVEFSLPDYLTNPPAYQASLDAILETSPYHEEGELKAELQKLMTRPRPGGRKGTGSGTKVVLFTLKRLKTQKGAPPYELDFICPTSPSNIAQNANSQAEETRPASHEQSPLAGVQTLETTPQTDDQRPHTTLQSDDQRSHTTSQPEGQSRDGASQSDTPQSDDQPETPQSDDQPETPQSDERPETPQSDDQERVSEPCSLAQIVEVQNPQRESRSASTGDIRIHQMDPPVDTLTDSLSSRGSDASSVNDLRKLEYLQSLRAYCSVLYLKPRMDIYICGDKVKTLFVRTILKDKMTYDFFQKDLEQKRHRCEVQFGKAPEELQDYGVLFYHKNRLIRPFVKLKCQTKASRRFGRLVGERVVGVVDVTDVMEPIHNKQDFATDTPLYKNIMSTLSSKLEIYCEACLGVTRQESPRPPSRPRGGGQGRLFSPPPPPGPARTDDESDVTADTRNEAEGAVTARTRSQNSRNRKRRTEHDDADDDDDDDDDEDFATTSTSSANTRKRSRRTVHEAADGLQPPELSETRRTRSEDLRNRKRRSEQEITSPAHEADDDDDEDFDTPSTSSATIKKRSRQQGNEAADDAEMREENIVAFSSRTKRARSGRPVQETTTEDVQSEEDGHGHGTQNSPAHTTRLRSRKPEQEMVNPNSASAPASSAPEVAENDPPVRVLRASTRRTGQAAEISALAATPASDNRADSSNASKKRGTGRGGPRNSGRVTPRIDKDALLLQREIGYLARQVALNASISTASGGEGAGLEDLNEVRPNVEMEAGPYEENEPEPGMVNEVEPSLEDEAEFSIENEAGIISQNETQLEGENEGENVAHPNEAFRRNVHTLLTFLRDGRRRKGKSFPPLGPVERVENNVKRVLRFLRLPTVE